MLPLVFVAIYAVPIKLHVVIWLVLMIACRTAIVGKILPLWSRTAFKFDLDHSMKSLHLSVLWLIFMAVTRPWTFLQYAGLPSVCCRYTKGSAKGVYSICDSFSYQGLLHNYCSIYIGPSHCPGPQSGRQNNDVRLSWLSDLRNTSVMKMSPLGKRNRN